MFVVCAVFMVVLVVGDQTQVDAEEEAENEGLNHTSEEFDRHQKRADRDDSATQQVHCLGSLVASVNVPVKPKAEGNVLHRFRDDFDDKNHSVDGNESQSHFGSGEVRKVSDHPVRAHPFVLYVPDGDESHTEIEAEIGCWRRGECQRNEVAEKDHDPEGHDHRHIFSSMCPDDSDTEVFDEDIELFGILSDSLGEEPLVQALFGTCHERNCNACDRQDVNDKSQHVHVGVMNGLFSVLRTFFGGSQHKRRQAHEVEHGDVRQPVFRSRRPG